MLSAQLLPKSRRVGSRCALTGRGSVKNAHSTIRTRSSTRIFELMLEREIRVTHRHPHQRAHCGGGNLVNFNLSYLGFGDFDLRPTANEGRNASHEMKRSANEEIQR